MQEKYIERKLVAAVKNMGGIAPKFVSPGFNGMPDRLVLLPMGRIAFVELKAPGKMMRPLQVRRKRQLEALGFSVYCISAVNKLLCEREEILGNFELIKSTVFDTADLEKEQAQLQNELEVVAGMIQQAIGENAHFALDQGEYQKRYNGLVDRFDLAKARHSAVTEEISDKQTRLSTINSFLYALRKQDNLLTEFDEKLWCSLVNYATVYNKDDVRFTFKDGTEIKA